MELSADDSNEDVPEAFHSSRYQQQPNNNNNNINNNIAMKMVSCNDGLPSNASFSDAEEAENENLEVEAASIYCDTNQNAKNISNISLNDDVMNDADEDDITDEELPQNPNTNLLALSEELKMGLACNFDSSGEETNKNSLMEQGACPTPDIIRKTPQCTPAADKQQTSSGKKENRPDLLRGVSPHFLHSEEFSGGMPSFEEHSPTRPTQSSAIYSDAPLQFFEKDEKLLGITPVDIIGDFGEEVEREFGLLVSGYRRLVEADVCSADVCSADVAPNTKVRS